MPYLALYHDPHEGVPPVEYHFQDINRDGQVVVGLRPDGETRYFHLSHYAEVRLRRED